MAGQAGAWRPRVHPEFSDPGPILDWPAVRAAFDGEVLSWPIVRSILQEIQNGARKGAMTDQPEESLDHEC